MTNSSRVKSGIFPHVFNIDGDNKQTSLRSSIHKILLFGEQALRIFFWLNHRKEAFYFESLRRLQRKKNKPTFLGCILFKTDIAGTLN